MLIEWIKWDNSCKMFRLKPDKEHSKFSYKFYYLLTPVILNKVTFLSLYLSCIKNPGSLNRHWILLGNKLIIWMIP